MTEHIVKWLNEGGEHEYDSFNVGDDPDPPGRWKCHYRAHHGGGSTDYWTILPKLDNRAERYCRRGDILDRDLTCHAVGMTCELVSYERIEEEPRGPSLIKLAHQIEASRASIFGTKSRKLVEVCPCNRDQVLVLSKPVSKVRKKRGKRKTMTETVPPLNGTKTHPLSEHAKGRLRDLRAGPIPSQEINPGVVNRFLRGDLAELVQLPSPYATHKGKLIGHVQITQTGIDLVDQFE